MRRPHLLRTVLVLACLPLVLGAAACGTTTSTSDFHGTQREVAQTIADLQSDVTSSDRKKICERDLAAGAVAKLGGQKACEAAVKNRLAEIDSTELKVESVTVDGEKATAKVKSVYGGDKRLRTVTLAKEGSRWRITAIS
jgi:hypothetical protein